MRCEYCGVEPEYGRVGNCKTCAAPLKRIASKTDGLYPLSSLYGYAVASAYSQQMANRQAIAASQAQGMAQSQWMAAQQHQWEMSRRGMA